MSENGIRIEEVESVEAPPKARVADVESAPETLGEKLERKRDYLEGFLAAQARGGRSGTSVGGDLYEA